jgi:hypothetical protein
MTAIKVGCKKTDFQVGGAAVPDADSRAYDQHVLGRLWHHQPTDQLANSRRIPENAVLTTEFDVAWTCFGMICHRQRQSRVHGLPNATAAL